MSNTSVPAAGAAAAAAAAPASSVTVSAPSAGVSSAGSDVKYDFAGRLAVVTGSTQGIGYAIALAYVRSGADVVVNGREQKRVDAAVAKLKAEAKLVPVPKAQRIVGAAGDVGSAAGCAAIAAAALAVGPIDFLVLNASILAKEMKPLLDNDDADWAHVYNINVLSVVRLGRALLPAMVKRNAHGRVIVTSSVAAYAPTSNMLPYTATKAAQTNVVKGMADATKGTTVTVNSLTVGLTLTEGLAAGFEPLIAQLNAARAAAGQPANATIVDVADAFIKSSAPHLPLQRGIAPDEVAAAALYLSSKAAIATNGAGLRVDGGYLNHI